MLSKKARIELRNQLFEEFKKLKIITQYIKNDKNVYRIDNKRLIYNLRNNSKLQNDYNKYIKEFRSEEEAKYCIIYNDDYTNHTCPICNKISEFHYKCQPIKYRKTCGNRTCVSTISNSKEAKEKSKQTCIKKFGYEYATQSPEIINKRKQTCIKLYGADNPFASIEIQKRIKETLIKEYGVEYISQNEKIKEKSKETCIKRNTFNNPIENKEIEFFINEIKKEFNDINIKIWNIYSNDKYFSKFIEIIYKYKNRLLRINEIKNIFGTGRRAIKEKIKRLDLISYFLLVILI